MGGSLGLGRIAGVRVQVHWSVLVIVALIAWGLSVGALPSAYPGYPTGGYVLAGTVAAVVFMVGLLAHEVSHSVVARRNGIDVDSITLWLFGGVAQLKGQPGDPGTELKVAGVGPLVSLLVGVLFGALAWAGGALGLSRLAVGTLAWLAAINVLLAVFNVLPAAPLDGGRLLKAALWRWRGDQQWATVTSARAGRVLGVALIALGLWQLFATGDLSALWLALVGWFVAGAATVEEQRARTDAALAGVPVRAVMTPDPETVGPDLTVDELVEHLLLSRRHSSYPLVEDGRLTGLVTLGRLKAVPAPRRSATRLGDIAYPLDEVPVAGPDEPVPALMERVGRAADGRVLVLQDGHLVGIVSPSDLTRLIERAGLRGRGSERPSRAP